MTEQHPEVHRTPDRYTCYHGFSAYELIAPDGVKRMAVRLFGHDYNDEIENDPTSDISEYVMTEEDCMTLLLGLLTAYEKMTGPLLPGSLN